VETEPDENLRYAHEPALESEPQPKIIVRHLAQGRIPRTSPRERVTSEEGTRPGRTGDRNQHIPVVEIWGRHATHHSRMWVNKVEIAIGRRSIGLLPQGRHRLSHSLWQQDVVGAEVAQDLTPRHCPALVQGRGLTHV